MPKECPLAVILIAKFSSVPPKCSDKTTAASFAERVMTAKIASCTVSFSPCLKPSLLWGCRAACAEAVKMSLS